MKCLDFCDKKSLSYFICFKMGFKMKSADTEIEERGKVIQTKTHLLLWLASRVYSAKTILKLDFAELQILSANAEP